MTSRSATGGTSSEAGPWRLRLEEALAESEQKFRAVFEQATIGIALGRLDGRCLRANEAACNFIGVTEEEVCRLSIQDIVHPDDLGLTADVFQRLVAGEVPSYSVERRYVRRDKTIVWGRASVSLVRDGRGRPLYLVGVMADVTHEKKVEQRQAVLSRLGYHLSSAVTHDQAAQVILDAADDLFGWDVSYLHIYSQRTGEVRHVLTMDTVKGRRVSIPEAAQASEPSAMMRKVMREGAQLINRGQTPALAAEPVVFGERGGRSASQMYVPVRSGGAFVGILSIQSYRPAAYSADDLKLLQALADLCGNALERIKMGEALCEAEAKYRGIFENAPHGIFQITSNGQILSANPALARMFGFGFPKEMMATVADIVRQLRVATARRKELRRLLENRDFVQGFEADCYRKDGSVFRISLDAHAVRDGSGSLLYYEGICRDITEIVRARETLSRSQEELERLVTERTAQLETANRSLQNEMANRQRLERQVLKSVEREQQRIGQDLHDGLCQLLAGIKFKAASLRARLQAKSLREADELGDIEDLVNRAIRQGYGLARGLNPVELPSRDLRSALKELAGSVKTAFGINCFCDCQLTVAIVDQTVANHLYRIAQEAIHNAIKHGKAKAITVTLGEQEGRIALAIQDDGAGFRPPAARKAGMGLQNMKARAGMMGAALEIRAGESGGTVVTCVLRIRKTEPKHG